MPGLTFRVWTCRAEFEARAPLRFPALAGNAFRGALGYRLPPHVFSPRADLGPSGLRDRPRPFVLRAAHLDSLSLAPGARFELRLNVFAEAALGPLRAALDGLGVQGAGLLLDDFSARLINVDLSARDTAPARVRVLLRTPLEMKGWSGAGLPPFAVLAARLRDRVSALGAFYQGGAPEFDFTGLAQRAAAVEAREGRLETKTTVRRSRRTDRTNPMGGLVGWVDYEGPLAEFVGLLEAGYWTGVGRHTVWGQGWIERQTRPAGED